MVKLECILINGAAGKSIDGFVRILLMASLGWDEDLARGCSGMDFATTTRLTTAAIGGYGAGFAIHKNPYHDRREGAKSSFSFPWG